MSSHAVDLSSTTTGIEAVDRLFFYSLMFVERRVREGTCDEELLSPLSQPELVQQYVDAIGFEAIECFPNQLTAVLGEEMFSADEVEAFSGPPIRIYTQHPTLPVVKWSFPIEGHYELARAALSDFLDIPTPNRVALDRTGQVEAVVSFVLLLHVDYLHTGTASDMRREAEENAAQLSELLQRASRGAMAFRPILETFVQEAFHRRMDYLKRRDEFVQWLNHPELMPR